MSVRIPIIQQSTSTSFVPMSPVSAARVEDPRPEARAKLANGVLDFGKALYDRSQKESIADNIDREDQETGQAMRDNQAAASADVADQDDADIG
jgi:hypothetical protein